MEKTKDFVTVDEAVCGRIKLMSTDDIESLYEAIDASSRKLVNLLNLSAGRISESDATRVKLEIMSELRRLERLVIIEGVSAKSFYEVQQHFRSMVRAANVAINWLKGSSAAVRLEALRTEGIELLNDLYEHIKELEGNEQVRDDAADQQNLKGDPLTARQRDRFVKVFADFAVLFRGFMGIADLFSDDPASIGGYTDMKDVISSLERDGLLDEEIGDAMAFYDSQARDVNPKKSIFGKLGGKGGGLKGKFANAIAKAWSTSPGAAKFMNANEMSQYLMTKTGDQLLAIFGRFNDFVANDVDTDWLFSVTKNPRTLGSMLKAVWDAFGSAPAQSSQLGRSR